MTSSATAADLKERVHMLRVERRLAIAAGLGDDPAYMADLEEELAGCEAAWVGASVTEIATLCGELFGRGQG